MFQLIGSIVALLGSLVLTLSGSVDPDGVSGGGPVGRPHPYPTPAIVMQVNHENPTTRH
jgi:hypothetical protein